MPDPFSGDIFEKAANRMIEALGGETDPDVLFYGSLEEQDFKGLMRRHGFEDVRRYITMMESKRLGIRRIFR